MVINFKNFLPALNTSQHRKKHSTILSLFSAVTCTQKIFMVKTQALVSFLLSYTWQFFIDDSE